MLRVPVATLLRGDGILPVLLVGGIYPNDTEQASSMSRDDYPQAFDSTGLLKPAALIQEDGSFSIPTIDRTLNETFRVFVWQAQGRGTIDAALSRIHAILSGITLQVGTLWVYELQWAGDGPNLRDQALDDAELGWSRWQAVAVR